MCKFFSCNSINGKLYYFDWKERQKLLKSNPQEYDPDSHDSIAHRFNLNTDKVNKYEYNPLTKEFKVDQINIKDDRSLVKKKLDKMDWETVVEPLIIKPIINPLIDVRKQEVTEKDIADLKEWAAVVAPVWDSIGTSVRASVTNLVGVSVWKSVWKSVWDGVWNGVWDEVWDSIGASVGANMASFFNIKYKEDYSCLIRLWERGFVPSYDGKTWRLHQGKNAKVVYTMKRKI